MFNKSIVTALRAMLLFCTSFSAAFSATGPIGAEQVPLAVEAAARAHVQRWADSSGLVEPKFELTVVRGSRPLAACSQAVTVEALDTRLPSRMRFAAVCAGADGWRYEFVVRAQVSARIAIMASDVPSGKILTDEDVLLERHDISGLADSVSDPQDVVGLAGRRALRSGEVLRMALLSAPTLVKRGDAVRIVARREQIEVSMAGEALDNGARGTMVRVRNANGTVIRARVTGAATVEPVDMPVSTSSPTQ
ncbi:flagella basal body P-ring formation protein FlgA [Duganella sp. BJB488]|nr:flagella basal body P-ring formation protein FlgA [Duganella sp. BJB489]RFP18174.1 flagella basal body P-ring formation protein FlgA [Duganella sp. BJB488]RFP37935.1 flagella basal body P-ring formation protein FlgA [Duganella sp. BJB480]